MRPDALHLAPLCAPPPAGRDARLQVLTTLPPDQLAALLAGDPVRAAPWVAAAAEAGLVEGELRYGRMLLGGEGVPRNETAAHLWFIRAARRGDAEAQNMVGRCFENGWGVAADPKAAARWFALAADQGHAWACYNLGHLYLDGLGVDRNRDQAFRLYAQAADAGHVRAMSLLARCYEEGWGVERDMALAQVWCRRAAEGGYFRAQYNWATLLAADGRLEAAAGWFTKAAEGASEPTRTLMARRLAESAVPALRTIGVEALNADGAAPNPPSVPCC
jgi:TPR repeat protein